MTDQTPEELPGDEVVDETPEPVENVDELEDDEGTDEVLPEPETDDE